MTKDVVQLSVVVPVYNESAGLGKFQQTLLKNVRSLVKDNFEIIYCDDGSTDETAALVRQWHVHDQRIKLLKLSRNFGKENALAAGIAVAGGQAVLMLDGDGQHPVERLPDFWRAYQKGAQVVVGVRNGGPASWFKRASSRLFYSLFNKLADHKLVAGATDYCLIDHAVQQAFVELPESDRLTRGLIDWLGFKRQFIRFSPAARRSGTPGYSRRKLFRLATNSFVSLTPTPLYLFGYLGVVITIAALLLGTAVFIEQPLLGDPWHWKFTGTAMLSILLLFLVGLVLMSQGITALYLSHIHTLSKRRPLYVIDHQGSAGIDSSS